MSLINDHGADPLPAAVVDDDRELVIPPVLLSVLAAMRFELADCLAAIYDVDESGDSDIASLFTDDSTDQLNIFALYEIVDRIRIAQTDAARVITAAHLLMADDAVADVDDDDAEVMPPPPAVVDLTWLPCEYCGASVPLLQLSEHQQQCQRIIARAALSERAPSPAALDERHIDEIDVADADVPSGDDNDVDEKPERQRACDVAVSVIKTPRNNGAPLQQRSRVRSARRG